MATSTSPVFNGQSTFSSDFQQVLTRAVSIASLPMQSMETDVSTETAQQQALSGLQAQFTALQDAVQAVDSAVQGSVSAQSSQPSAVSATTTSSALPGAYSIEVDSIGSSTTTLSKASLTTVTDPTANDISSSSTFTLTINGTAHKITSTGSSLTSLASAINAAGDGVKATILNIGSNSSPDYRLAITSNNLAPDTIQLNDGTQDLMDTLSTGAAATYKVNGGTTQLQSNSNQVTLAPGLTVNLLQPTATGQTATITVSSDYSSLDSALTNLATAYNSAVDTVTAQRGTNGGALQGESTVFALTNVLESISQYTGGSGSIENLTALGLNLDSSGHLTFDPTQITSANIASAQQFLGSTATGGFLQSANNALTAVDDPNTGLIQTDINGVTDHITTLNNQISDEQTRIDDLTTNLQAQLSAADAAIATLQEQKSYYTSLFDATYLTNNGTSN